MKNKEISFLIFNGFIAVHVKSITKYAYIEVLCSNFSFEKDNIVLG